MREVGSYQLFFEFNAGGWSLIHNRRRGKYRSGRRCPGVGGWKRSMSMNHRTKKTHHLYTLYVGICRIDNNTSDADVVHLLLEPKHSHRTLPGIHPI